MLPNCLKRKPITTPGPNKIRLVIEDKERVPDAINFPVGMVVTVINKDISTESKLFGRLKHTVVLDFVEVFGYNAGANYKPQLDIAEEALEKVKQFACVSSTEYVVADIELRKIYAAGYKK